MTKRNTLLVGMASRKITCPQRQLLTAGHLLPLCLPPTSPVGMVCSLFSRGLSALTLPYSERCPYYCLLSHPQPHSILLSLWILSPKYYDYNEGRTFKLKCFQECKIQYAVGVQ